MSYFEKTVLGSAVDPDQVANVKGGRLPVSTKNEVRETLDLILQELRIVNKYNELLHDVKLTQEDL